MKGLVATMIAVVLATTAGTVAAETVALTGGTIITVSGEPIENGTIVITHGKITAIGAEVDLPFDAVAIDVSGKTLFPGMVLAHTSSGMDVANENLPLTPFVDVYDSIDPSSSFFEDSLRGGITTINVQQGAGTVVGGVGRVVRPVGLMVEEMTVRTDAGLKIAITPKRGFDSLVQAATLREAFAELDDYIDGLAEKKYDEKLEKDEKKIDVLPAEARKRGRELLKASDFDDKHLNLWRLTKGELDAYVYCGRAMDVARGIDLAKERGFFDRMTLVLGAEAFKAIDVIKAAGRPVILDADLVHTEIDPMTGEEEETFVPSVFAKAGVPFALQVNPGASNGSGHLNFQAARCLRGDVDRDTAIAAITTVPAGILGLSDHVGTLEVGRHGNVLVLSGDPLDLTTMVEQVYIDGRKAYDMENDRSLRRLIEGKRADMGVEDGDDDAASEGDDAASESESDTETEAAESGDGSGESATAEESKKDSSR